MMLKHEGYIHTKTSLLLNGAVKQNNVCPLASLGNLSDIISVQTYMSKNAYYMKIHGGIPMVAFVVCLLIM